MAAQRRYPGTPPFQKQDANIFFGREQDTQDLLELIQLKELVVLYGKSGLGKTSLLNAGIIPALDNINQEVAEEGDGTTYEAMKVRFFAWKDENSQSPVETLWSETVGQVEQHPLLTKAGVTTDSLWYRFKSHQLHQATPATYILFFDQFEELLFTYPSEQIKDFIEALTQLLNAHIPADLKQNLRERFRTDKNLFSKEENQRLLQPIVLKVVLSIRSDRLSLLDKMSGYLPNILVNLYELKTLNSVQARAAIAFPAAQEGDFGTPIFQYSDVALSGILTHLSAEDDRIEPFQIQYICEHAEELVKTTKKTLLNQSDLGDLSLLFENYYHHKIAEIGNAAEEGQARHLLEDRLLFNGVRLSLLEEQITSAAGFGLSITLLKKLEDVRLLRAERRGEQVYYEITHDTLVDPIVRAQEVRKTQERRRRLVVLGVLGLVFFLIVLAGFFGIYNLYQNAKINEKKAVANEIRAEEALKEADLAKNDALLKSEIIEEQKDSILMTLASLQQALEEADLAKNDALLKSEIIEEQKDSILFTLESLKEALIAAEDAKTEALNQKGFAEKSVTQFKKSFATYLMSEAKKVFIVDNPRLTFRLAQEALKFYPENLDARTMLNNLSFYLSHTFDIFSGGLDTMKLSSDNKHLLFFTDVKDDRGTLQVLNLQTQQQLTFPNSENDIYSYSPDNKYLLFFTDVKDSKGSLQVLNLQTQQQLTFPNSNSNIYSYSYSPDSKHLIFFTDIKNSKGSLQVLNLQTQQQLTFPNSNSYIYSYKYSSDSKHFVFFTNVKDKRGTLQVLNLQTQQQLTFPNSENDRYSYRYKYSPDSKHLIFFTDVKQNKGILHSLNLQNQQEITFPNSYKYRNRYSPDSKYLVFFTDVKDDRGTLQVLNLQTQQQFNFPNSQRGSNKYSPDSKYLAFFTDVKDNKGKLQILNLQNQQQTTFPNSYNYSDKYNYSPDSKYLVFFTDVKDDKGTLQVLNLQNQRQTTFPNIYQYGDRYSPDGKYFLFFTDVKDDKGMLHVLNLQNQGQTTFPNTYQYSGKYSDSYKYSSDGKYLVLFTDVKGDKSTLHLLNLQTQQQLAFPNTYQYKYRYKYSPDGKHFTFFTNTKDNKVTLQLLNLQTQQQLAFPNSHSYNYSSDSKHLVFFTNTKYNKDTLHILNLQNQQQFAFPNNYKYSDKYSPDSKKLAYLSYEQKKINIINLNTMQEIRTVQHQTKIESFEFSKDNRYIMSSSKYPGSENGVLKITDLHIEGDLLEYYDEFYAPLTKEEKERYGLE